MDNLMNEITFYKTHRAEFIKQYAGKHIAIKGMKVVGVFNTRSNALEEMDKLHGKDTYIIERPMDLTIPRSNIRKR